MYFLKVRESWIWACWALLWLCFWMAFFHLWENLFQNSTIDRQKCHWTFSWQGLGDWSAVLVALKIFSFPGRYVVRAVFHSRYIVRRVVFFSDILWGQWLRVKAVGGLLWSDAASLIGSHCTLHTTLDTAHCTGLHCAAQCTVHSALHCTLHWTANTRQSINARITKLQCTGSTSPCTKMHTLYKLHTSLHGVLHSRHCTKLHWQHRPN